MFSDELIGLDIAHGREMGRLARDAQALVDHLDRDVRSLRLQLAAAKQSNTDLRLERGRRNNEKLLARMAQTRH